ncbi:uncharacterized protein [Eucyclogobius newberryi]|uniref:uncharacterized protein isoform X2 n=1 Tax=Eucyclogobius newberryi TaxID=166745 RepID=UPI003B59AFDE
MSTRTINLDTYSLSLLTAKEDIINPRSSINWALFVYDGISNKLRLADSGVGGVAELASKLHTSQAQYGLCRMVNADSGSSRTAMIIWMGQDVDDFRRTECASHIPAIKNFFKEVNVFLNAEKSEEVTEERIKAELSKAHTNASTQWLRRSSQSSMDRKDIVGTNYRKTNAAMEMRLANRDSFWARAEREEEERKEEERKRAAEERRRLERERTLKERQDAEERDRKMNEKLKMIEEQRQIAAEQEEEGQRKEKFKWELQQREHEEEMRARLKRSESIEKAAEAAALVSQRTMNPREFFRQLSSSSSLSPTSPSRSGKPFRRYQRSLTDTAFIFSKAEESSASSPRSSPVVSPFSRASPSPFNRATSPPTSPLFLPSTSPQRTRASPPLSPPPSSALPSVPLANIQMRGRARSPSEPSAPPASPTLVASVGLSSAGDAPGSPPNVTEHNAFNFELNASPPAPRASLPEHPISAAELASEISYKVQTVLVEEDEEEEADVKEKEDTQPKTEPRPDPEEPFWEEAARNETQTQLDQVETVEEEEVKEEKGELLPCTEPEETSAEEEQAQTATRLEKEVHGIEYTEYTEYTQTEVKQAEEQTEETAEVKQEPDQSEKHLSPEWNEAALLRQHEDASEFTDPISEESLGFKCLTPDSAVNVIPNGNSREHNGTDHSLSPSDPELDSPELAVYCNVRDDEEDDICIQKYITISENGEEVSAEPHLCVRALYDYQAEDESELSFELGDIIRDVEAVDKGWWRGWSQDGRQGLFPANYVETISPQ